MDTGKSRIKTKICATLIAAVLVFFNIVPAYAITVKFTDITSHWAKPYIEKLTAAKITTGVEMKNGVGKYAPESPVKRVEVVAMLIRLLGLEKEAEAMTLPSSFPKSTEVPSWARGIVAMAASKGIIPANEDFKANDDAIREDVAIFTVRALGYGDEAEGKTTVNPKILDFTDLHQISLKARGYVEVAKEKGIMAGIGDNIFDPKGKFTRGQMAKLIDNALRYKPLKGEILGEVDSVETLYLKNITVRLPNGTLSSYSVDSDAGIYKRLDDYNLEKVALGDIKKGERVSILPDDKPNYTFFVEIVNDDSAAPLDPGRNKVKGTVLDLNDVTRRVTVAKDSGGEEDFNVKIGVEIYIGTRNGTFADLDLGQPVTLTIDQGTVTKVEAKEIEKSKKVSGMLRSVVTDVISIRDDDTDSIESYRTRSDLQCFRDDKRATLRDLMIGDVVELTVMGDIATRIDARSAIQEITGHIKTINLAPKNPIITVEISKGNTEDYEFSGKVSISKNRDRYAEVEDLKKGDEVLLKLEYNKVISISATSVKTNVKGSIKSITFEKEKTRITIADHGGEEHSFIITRDTDLREGRRRFNPEDLKIGYHLDLELENEEAIYIQVTAQEELQTFQGIVATINTSREIIGVEVSGDFRDIFYNSDTLFVKGKDTITVRRLTEGDKVVVVGEYVEGVFEANSIMVLNLD